jgi:hypothetical protein
MTEITRIIDAHGIHPTRLDQDVIEQALWHQGRFIPADPTMVFVFGSNEGGRHGKGAALFAQRYRGAIYGDPEGHQGNSYALPTCDRRFQGLPLSIIQAYVDRFLSYARRNAHITFQVTQVGCGLGGYTPQDIAPMFTKAPKNCLFDTAWRHWLPGVSFWGTA